MKDESIKSALTKIKSETILVAYIDDLLLATPKSLGVDIHLCLFKFVMVMMVRYRFRVNRKRCTILTDSVTF